MKRTANVEWDGHNWVAVTDTGAATSAKRLDKLPALVADVIRLMTGETVDPDDVELDIKLADPALDKSACEIAAMRADLAHLEQTLANHRRNIIAGMRSKGFTVRDIGVVTGLSHQRVDQILKA